MNNTTNYALEKYEAGNSANLLDQYNESMDKIDAAEGYPIPPAK